MTGMRDETEPRWTTTRFGLTRPETAGVLAVLVGGLLVLVAAVVAARFVLDVYVSDLFMDPSVVADYADYVGVVSNLGVMVWVAAAAVALLGASLLGPRSAEGGFLLSVGALTGLMALDDMFRGHENLATAAGAPEADSVVVIGYGVVAVLLLWRHRQTIRSATPVVLLAGAALLFGASVTADALLDRPGLDISGQVLLEDGTKLLGILLWASYLVVVTRRSLSGARGTAVGEDQERLDLERAGGRPDDPGQFVTR
jgi:hypothetical protein